MASVRTKREEILNHIYLVRHGENPANITKEFSYRKIDYPLTPKGRFQAAQTAAHFTTVRVDEIYTSPLKRAVETAQAIADAVGKPLTVCEGFREVNIGELEDMPPDRVSWGLYLDVMREWLAGNRSARFPGGESRDELTDRFVTALSDVTRGKDGRHIVIVGHGGIFTYGVADLCRIADQRAFFSIESHNCAIAELSLDWSCGGVEGTLLSWAVTDHLSGEAAVFVDAVPEHAKVGTLDAE